MPRAARALALAAALFWGAGAQAEGPALVSPIGPACVSSPFGPRAGRLHSGIDLPAVAGTWVRAAAAGRVVAIRRLGAAGLEVQLAHADGTRTRYAHLGSVTPALAEGRREVAQGERLGRVGRTGVSRGTHLHFELHRDGRAVDAAPLLGLAPCGRPAR